MFYSTEVLTSRKYGVATVWLVATLGSKSMLKKISRKAIQNVNVQKACETIMTPEAPLALRLQSNLLYGVARVYHQQCGYLLREADGAVHKLRGAIHILKSNTIEDERHHRARPENIVLQDDNDFTLELDAPLGFELAALNDSLAEESSRSTLSPYALARSHPSATPIGGLDIPLALGSSSIAPLQGNLGFSGIGRDSESTHRRPQDDLGFLVGDDGELHFTEDVHVPQDHGFEDVAMTIENGPQPIERDQFAQYEPAHSGGVLGHDHVDVAEYVASNEANNEIATLEAQVLQRLLRDESEHRGSQRARVSTSPVVAQAPIRRRRVVKLIPIDQEMELHNRDLARWSNDYASTMATAVREHETRKLSRIAKINAELFVLGTGHGIAAIPNDSPLFMFTGAAIFNNIAANATLHAGDKHTLDDDEEESSASKRRQLSQEHALNNPNAPANNNNDDAFLPLPDEDVIMEIERGRENPTPLEDHHLSSLLPWNRSGGSQQHPLFPSGRLSHAFRPSSSLGAGGMISPSRRGSRLISASPLHGRGASLGPDGATDLAAAAGLPFHDDEGMDLTNLGLGDERYASELGVGPLDMDAHQAMTERDRVRMSLDMEDRNFLAFVQAGVREADDLRAHAAVEGHDVVEEEEGTVRFEDLLPPEANTFVVAAQGLLHVLSLVTKDMLRAEQEKAFGDIVLRAVEV